MPFHAAEQHNKKQKNNSAERRDFPRCLLFVSAQGSQPQAVQVIGCLFFAASLLVRFFAPFKTGYKGKLSVNHLVVSLPDNRRQVHMTTKK